MAAKTGFDCNLVSVSLTLTTLVLVCWLWCSVILNVGMYRNIHNLMHSSHGRRHRGLSIVSGGGMQHCFIPPLTLHYIFLCGYAHDTSYVSGEGFSSSSF